MRQYINRYNFITKYNILAMYNIYTIIVMYLCSPVNLSGYVYAGWNNDRQQDNINPSFHHQDTRRLWVKNSQKTSAICISYSLNYSCVLDCVRVRETQRINDVVANPPDVEPSTKPHETEPCLKPQICSKHTDMYTAYTIAVMYYGYLKLTISSVFKFLKSANLSEYFYFPNNLFS